MIEVGRLRYDPVTSLYGFRLIEDPSMTEDAGSWDFSACRSPARARRRFARGIVGRVTRARRPKREVLKLDLPGMPPALVAHPVVIGEIEREVEARMRDAKRTLSDRGDAMVYAMMAGRPET